MARSISPKLNRDVAETKNCVYGTLHRHPLLCKVGAQHALTAVCSSSGCANVCLYLLDHTLSLYTIHYTVLSILHVDVDFTACTCYITQSPYIYYTLYTIPRMSWLYMASRRVGSGSRDSMHLVQAGCASGWLEVHRFADS